MGTALGEIVWPHVKGSLWLRVIFIAESQLLILFSVTRLSITALQGALDCTFQHLPQLPTHCKLKKTIRLRIARVEYNQNTPYLYICLNVTKKSPIAMSNI